jgi:radical SAM protein with 4Fe4S-binding SPASM domain
MIFHYDKEYFNNRYYSQREYKKCNVGKHSIHITNNGAVHPCAGFPIEVGNIYRQSIGEIWENSNELNMIRSIKKEAFDCNYCTYKNHCINKCMGVIYNFNSGESFTRKNEELCNIKRSQAEIINLLKKIHN